MFSFINLGLGTFLLWGIFSFFFDSADHEYFSFFEKCSFLMVRLLVCVCVCVCVVLKLEIFALYSKEHFE